VHVLLDSFAKLLNPKRVHVVLDSVAHVIRPERSFHQPADEPTVRNGSIVVAFHPQLLDIGHAILDSGGNAFDAFVAVAAAQNVLAEGASSLAGPLGVLGYAAARRSHFYLDADFNDPLDPAWRWDARMPKDGRAVFVPGAPAGLEALASRYGTRPFAELLQPAIRLAEEGFPVSKLLATFIAWRAKVLKRSDYGQKTFFSSNGKPLRPGQIIRQPEVGGFLSNLAAHGSSYVYSGDWGARFLQTVQANHGVLTLDDLSAYRVQSEIPWTATYRGHRVSSCSGRAYGGLWTLLALKTLEHTSLPAEPHYASDPDLLQLLVQIAREVWGESWILDFGTLGDRALVEHRLRSAHARRIWERVGTSACHPQTAVAGAHSYHIIVVDQDGNAATGTTTIEADPWGEGMFVEGVPLATAAPLPLSTAPGKRRLSPFSMHLVFRDDLLRFSVGTISVSVPEAAFQLLVNLIDYRLPVDQAVSLPRFGSFPAKRKLDLRKNWLDPRISNEIVKDAENRGLKFDRKGIIDTGLGTVMAADPSGVLSGVHTPLPYMSEPFATGT
jgi:gamma-glutamyltranspeptidase / glutathione hydrolase